MFVTSRNEKHNLQCILCDKNTGVVNIMDKLNLCRHHHSKQATQYQFIYFHGHIKLCFRKPTHKKLHSTKE